MMNAFVKGQIITEIKNPANKVKRIARMGDEEMSVIAPTGRVLIEIFNDWDSGMGYFLKLGGEKIDVDLADFTEIASALRVRCCNKDSVEKLSAKDKKILELLSGKGKEK